MDRRGGNRIGKFRVTSSKRAFSPEVGRVSHPVSSSFIYKKQKIFSEKQKGFRDGPNQVV